MFKKILYVGTGNHIEPVNHFSDTKEFIFIDSQPRNEYGHEYYYKPFYRPLFLTELKLKLKLYNFKLYDEIKLTDNYSEINIPYLNPTKLYFGDKKGLNLRDERSLIYYISTGFPKNYFDIEKQLREDLKDCDSILISGHHPHSIFVKDIKKPFNMIGYGQTYFPKNYKAYLDEDIDDKYSVISYILQNPQDVKKYIYVTDNGEKKIFDTYDDFYNHHKSNQQLV